MARRLFLHIGTMKSATTYLQDLLDLNTKVLADRGVLWVPLALRYLAVSGCFGRTVQGEDAAAAWRKLTRQIRRHPGDVVLSNELLAGLNPKRIRRLLGPLDADEVHVVITARDLGRTVPSHWQTTIKNGQTHRWSQFASAVCADPTDIFDGDDNTDDDSAEPDEAVPSTKSHEWFWYRHDLQSVVERWQRVVPLERMTLVTVPARGSDQETVARRFGAAMGLDLGGLEQPAAERNPSLGAHSAELMRRLNHRVQDADRVERKYGFRHLLANETLALRRNREPKIALSDAQQEWVRNRAARMVEWVKGSQLRVEGDLDDLMPAERPQSGALDPEDSTEAQLQEVALDGLVGLVRGAAETRLERNEYRDRNKKLQSENNRLRRQLEH